MYTKIIGFSFWSYVQEANITSMQKIKLYSRYPDVGFRIIKLIKI